MIKKLAWQTIEHGITAVGINHRFTIRAENNKHRLQCLNLITDKVIDIIDRDTQAEVIAEANLRNKYYARDFIEPVSEPLAEQTASVITQPVDATEPLTLVEKLEREVKRLSDLKAKEKPDSLEYMFLGHHIVATVNAINIVKQQQDESGWVSVSERLPPVAQPVLVYNYGNLRVLPLCKTDSGLKWLDEFGQDEFDLDEIDFWQRLPQPPSEVQA